MTQFIKVRIFSCINFFLKIHFIYTIFSEKVGSHYRLEMLIYFLCLRNSTLDFSGILSLILTLKKINNLFKHWKFFFFLVYLKFYFKWMLFLLLLLNGWYLAFTIFTTTKARSVDHFIIIILSFFYTYDCLKMFVKIKEFQDKKKEINWVNWIHG